MKETRVRRCSALLPCRFLMVFMGWGLIILSGHFSNVPLAWQAVDKPGPAPELFAPGIVSTPGDETAGTVSPDGRTLFFSRSGAIWETHHENGEWSRPEVATFSGQFGDYYPSFSPDGSRLFFTSNRPSDTGQSPSTNFDLWVVVRNSTGWSEPENLGGPVNTNDGEVYCSTTKDGTLFFGAGRGNSRHIMLSRLVSGKYSTPESLGTGINTTYFQGYHAISPDGQFIVFTSNRPGGFGGMDLYSSFNKNGSWTAPRNLGSVINSPADETHASISSDGKYLFFTSNRSCLDAPPEKRLSYLELIEKLRGTLGGNRNIYRIQIGALNLAQ